MNKSDKIRAHFRKHPDADVAKVAAKFEAPKPMTYKLRKQVQEEGVVDAGEWGKSIREAGAELTALTMPDLLQDTDIDETLDERAQDYGKFKDGAALMQALKRTLADHARMHNKTFSDDQWEALEMIVHKIGRIVNGNPDKVDSWVDIAGYATLVADRLQGNAR
jgi:predicted methyltransferase